MSEMASKIIVIGAGPAGMMLAYLLAGNGVPVTVLERHPDFHREFRGEILQPSVAGALEELGLLAPLVDSGIAVPEAGLSTYQGDRPLGSLGTGRQQVLAVSQPRFLEFLDGRCRRHPHYQLALGTTVKGLLQEGGKVLGVQTPDGPIEGELVVACNGRNNPLRKTVGLCARTLEDPMSVLWIRLDGRAHRELLEEGLTLNFVPGGMLVAYPTTGDRLQLGWTGREDLMPLLRDPAELRKRLLSLAPRRFHGLVGQLDEQTERQILKVHLDRLDRWHVPGLLFLGDAAHTMSPMGGQGVNLAIRDSIVAANHLIAAIQAGSPLDDAVCQRIEDERRPEIETMQAFQVQSSKLMFDAPPWVRAMLFTAIPWLNRLGARQGRHVQHGVTDVQIRYPVPYAEEASFPVS